MDGQRFVARIHYWPPPRKLIGREIHGSLAGTYELQEATTKPPFAARYKLREDDDYLRLLKLSLERVRESS